MVGETWPSLTGPDVVATAFGSFPRLYLPRIEQPTLTEISTAWPVTDADPHRPERLLSPS